MYRCATSDIHVQQCLVGPCLKLYHDLEVPRAVTSVGFFCASLRAAVRDYWTRVPTRKLFGEIVACVLTYVVLFHTLPCHQGRLVRHQGLRLCCVKRERVRGATLCLTNVFSYLLHHGSLQRQNDVVMSVLASQYY